MNILILGYLLKFVLFFLFFFGVFAVILLFRHVIAKLTCKSKKITIKEYNYAPFMQFPLCLPSLILNTYNIFTKKIGFTDSVKTKSDNINIIFGFIVGLKPNPDYDSFKIGWRTLNKKTIQILAIYYIEDIKKSVVLFEGVKTNSDYDYRLTISRTTDSVIFEGLERNYKTSNYKQITVPFKSPNKVGWKLGWYFEGDEGEPAPHDIEFRQIY